GSMRIPSAGWWRRAPRWRWLDRRSTAQQRAWRRASGDYDAPPTAWNARTVGGYDLRPAPRGAGAAPARVVKSVNTVDLKSIAVRLAGSNPAPGTPRPPPLRAGAFCCPAPPPAPQPPCVTSVSAAIY